MNALNRLLIVLAALLLIGIAIAAIVIAWASPEDGIDRLGDLVEYLDAHNDDTSKLVLTLGGAIVALLALALALLELTPPQTPRVEVRDVETGVALLSTEAIARRLEQIAAGLEQVVMARAKVLPRRRGVEVVLNISVEPDSDVAAVADRASRVVQETLANSMKVELAKPPRLHIGYLEPVVRKGRRAPGAAKEVVEAPAPKEVTEATPELPAGEDKPEERVKEEGQS